MDGSGACIIHVLSKISLHFYNNYSQILGSVYQIYIRFSNKIFNFIDYNR